MGEVNPGLSQVKAGLFGCDAGAHTPWRVFGSALFKVLLALHGEALADIGLDFLGALKARLLINEAIEHLEIGGGSDPENQQPLFHDVPPIQV